MTRSFVMATPLDMIEAHLTWMRAGTFAENTTNGAEKLLHRLHRDLPAGLHGALAEELADWLASNPAWSEQTIATYYKHIVRFYRWAVQGRHPWLSYDPSAELHRPTALPGLPRPAGEDKIAAAINHPKTKWRLVYRLAGLAGLRPFDIAGLHRHDITERVITVKGKGGKTRAVPTHPLIWEMVKDLPPGRLISGPRGYPATAEYVSRSGAYYLRKAGIDCTLYGFRHYFGTEIQERYRDLRVTQELMGHASPNTTAGYTQVTSARMREAVGMLPFSGAGTSAAQAETVPDPHPGVAAAPSQHRYAANAQGEAGRAIRRRSLRRARP